MNILPDRDNTYAGFDGSDLVALVIAQVREGLCAPPTWQWCAWSERYPNKRFSRTLSDADGRAQPELDLEAVGRRAAQSVGYGFLHPVGLRADECPDRPSVVILPPEEVDT